MVTLERTTRRVGRSQAASIFWGLVSCFFAAAACFYFWKYHENDTTTNVLRDQVLTLQEQLETLNSQKDQLQSNMSDTEAQLKTREEFLQDKETKLGEEESRLEGLAMQSDTQSAQSGSQAAVVKKFNDAVRKLVKGNDTDVVVRGGRPVLRVPSSLFFDFGETALKPEGKTMLRQIAQTLDGQLGNFELRIETFTDSGGEMAPSSKPAADATAAPEKNATAPNADDKTTPANPVPPVKAPENPGWALTGKRAGVLARYIREQTSLPFQNVLVIPRADSQPIIPSGTESNARNRRVEITITPSPAVFRASDVTGLDSVKPASVKTTDHKSAQSAIHPAAKTATHVKPPVVSKSSDTPKTDDDSETPAPTAKKSTTQSSKQ